MQSYKDLLAVKLEDGRTICVCAPGYKALDGFLVETTNGYIGRVIQVEMAVPEETKQFVSRFATIYTAKNIWAVSWQREAAKDA